MAIGRAGPRAAATQAGDGTGDDPGSDDEDSAPVQAGKPARVERLLANLGYGKRKECQAMCRRRRVTHASSGKLLKVGAKALHSEVLLDGEPLDAPWPLAVLLHKPCGYVVTSPDDENVPDPVVYDLLPYRFGRRKPFLSAVGRLDKETSGLLLLTDDGQLLHRIISPRKGIWKLYRAKLEQPLVGAAAAAAARKFASGTLTLGGQDVRDRQPLLPAKLTMLDDTTAEVALCEGRYHQIRRMFAALGHTVVGLHRHTIGGLSLGDLPEGEWRYLGAADIQRVFDSPSAAAAPQGGDATADVGPSERTTASLADVPAARAPAAATAALAAGPAPSQRLQGGEPEEGDSASPAASREEGEEEEGSREQAALTQMYRSSARHRQRRLALRLAMQGRGAPNRSSEKE